MQLDEKRTRQAASIAAWLRLFIAPEQTTELRAILGPRRVKSAYFGGTNLDAMAALAIEMEVAKAKGVYFTPNPLRPELSAAHASAADADVLSRRWLLIDVDPVRPADTSSTQEERDLAWKVMESVWSTMDGADLKGGILGDSGNGWHVCYPLDLPNDEPSKQLVRRLLRELHARCSTESAAIDTSVFNAARIWKIYGTRAQKGPVNPERPHRWARILDSAPAQPWESTVATANAQAVALLLDRWDRAAKMRGGKTTDPGAAWAHAALRDESAAVAGAREGTRHIQLNTSAFNLYQIVAGGYLSDAQVAAELKTAALGSGLPEAEVDATIHDARVAGMAKPRSAPVGPAPSTNGTHPAQETPAPKSKKVITADDVATIADLVRAGSEVHSLWPGWIQIGVLTAIAAEGGTGKTRFCADLLRRIRLGLPWPDGQAMTVPKDALALWVVADNHHDEMVTLSQRFGITEAIRLNAPRDDPYGGVTLEMAEDLADLEARIAVVKPVLVIIDTVGNSTDKNLSRQEDAKAYYQPLQVLARKYRCAILCLTHLNAQGKSLGRRVKEKVRVEIMMDKPDPSSERRRLWVEKTNSKRPSPLGVTMGDEGNEYDDAPPAKVEAGPVGGEIPVKVREAMDWLRTYLSTGMKRVSNTRSAAETAGINSQTLYRAKDALGVSECSLEGRKWWELAAKEPEEETAF